MVDELLAHTSLIGLASSERELIDSHDTLSESDIHEPVVLEHLGAILTPPIIISPNHGHYHVFGGRRRIVWETPEPYLPKDSVHVYCKEAMRDLQRMPA